MKSTLVLLAACHSATPTPPDPHAQIVDHLVGTWAGQAKGTPFGDFTFRLAFARRSDGAVHARLDGGGGMYLDFTFRHATAGWMLVEEGAIPSVGTQTHTLAPAGDTHWTDATLDVDLRVTADTLAWTTLVRGKPHAVFALHRVQ